MEKEEKYKVIMVSPSVAVLQKAIEIQRLKSKDYQNPNSSVKQADHYPHGVWTIYDMVHQKLIRIKSLLEAIEFDNQNVPNFEGIEDSAVDAINYLSFMVSYLNKNMDGQDETKDIFNKKIKK
jgi:hypothetical protein